MSQPSIAMSDSRLMSTLHQLALGNGHMTSAPNNHHNHNNNNMAEISASVHPGGEEVPAVEATALQAHVKELQDQLSQAKQLVSPNITHASRAQRENIAQLTVLPDGTPIPILKFHFAPFDPRVDLRKGHERQELLFLARHAEQAQRYHDMAVITRHLVHFTGGKLSREERTLFYIAHVRIILPIRNAIKVLNQHFASPATAGLAQEYRRYLHHELKTFCFTLIDFIQTSLVTPLHTLPDHVVFFLKMVGDLYRYVAELNPLSHIAPTNSHVSVAVGKSPQYQSQHQYYYMYLCRHYYHEAALVAEKYFAIAQPLRLGVLLAYAVAAFELFRDYKTACEITKMCFDKAIVKIETLEEEDYRDSTLLLQLMRDNLQLWVAMQHSAAHPRHHFPPSLDIQGLKGYNSSVIAKEAHLVQAGQYQSARGNQSQQQPAAGSSNGSAKPNNPQDMVF